MKEPSFHSILERLLEEPSHQQDSPTSVTDPSRASKIPPLQRETPLDFSSKLFWFPQKGRGTYAQFAPPPSSPSQKQVRPLGSAEVQALLIFQNLGAVDLSSSSTLDQLKQAFRLLAKQWHPDKHEGQPPAEKREVCEKFCQLKRSYDCLRKAFS